MRLDIISLTWCDTVLFSSFRVSRRAKDFEQQLERLREVLVLDFSFSLLKLCSVLAGHPSVPAGEMTRCSRVVYDWCHQSASGAFFQSLPTTRTTLRWNWKKNEIYWMKRCNIHHCDAGISCIIKDIVLGTLQGTNRSFAPRRTVYGAGCCEERAGKHLLVQLNCFYSALMGAAFSCLRSLSNLLLRSRGNDSTLPSYCVMATGDHGAFFNAFFLVVNHRSLENRGCRWSDWMWSDDLTVW